MRSLTYRNFDVASENVLVIFKERPTPGTSFHIFPTHIDINVFLPLKQIGILPLLNKLGIKSVFSTVFLEDLMTEKHVPITRSILHTSHNTVTLFDPRDGYTLEYRFTYTDAVSRDVILNVSTNIYRRYGRYSFPPQPDELIPYTPPMDVLFEEYRDSPASLLERFVATPPPSDYIFLDLLEISRRVPHILFNDADVVSSEAVALLRDVDFELFRVSFVCLTRWGLMPELARHVCSYARLVPHNGKTNALRRRGFG